MRAWVYHWPRVALALTYILTPAYIAVEMVKAVPVAWRDTADLRREIRRELEPKE